jgi:hypothetical protein
MRLTKLTVGFKWDKKGEGADYTFASIIGAREWIDNNRDQINWYAIIEVEYIPCNENNPMGQLYQGVLYHEFTEFKEGK